MSTSASTTSPNGAATITPDEFRQIERANASGLQPVVFVHGLWLLPNSWERWTALFENAGFIALTPGWPDDPATVAEARANPAVFARKTVGQIADHMEAVIRKLARKPIVVGHSFGGLLVQILAGRGLAVATVAIDPAPFRGVLPLPFSALKAAWPVLGNPFNKNRSIALTFQQFRFAFANAVGVDEAKQLYDRYSVAGSAAPLFQASRANLNPWTEAKVNSTTSSRGPLLIVSGEKDNTVPWAIANASFKRQRRNSGVTEIVEMAGRGHSLVIDRGWQEVAGTALKFAQRFT
jgi:pimeloyl-ACP methyl ester carboxylesterase